MPAFVGHSPNPHIPEPGAPVVVAPSAWTAMMPEPFARHERLRVLRRERWMRPVIYVAADHDGRALLVGKSLDLVQRIGRHEPVLARQLARAPAFWGYVPMPDHGADGGTVDVDLVEEAMIRVLRPMLLGERTQAPTGAMLRAARAVGFTV